MTLHPLTPVLFRLFAATFWSAMVAVGWAAGSALVVGACAPFAAWYVVKAVTS